MPKKYVPLREVAKQSGIVDFIFKVSNYDALLEKAFPDMTAWEYYDYLDDEVIMKGNVCAITILWMLYYRALNYVETSPLPIMSDEGLRQLKGFFLDFDRRIKNCYQVRIDNYVRKQLNL